MTITAKFKKDINTLRSAANGEASSRREES